MPLVQLLTTLATLALYALSPLLIGTLLLHAAFELPPILGGMVDRDQPSPTFWTPGAWVALSLYGLLFLGILAVAS